LSTYGCCAHLAVAADHFDQMGRGLALADRPSWHTAGLEKLTSFRWPRGGK
jgi:hypothetical protein